MMVKVAQFWRVERREAIEGPSGGARASSETGARVTRRRRSVGARAETDAATEAVVGCFGFEVGSRGLRRRCQATRPARMSIQARSSSAVVPAGVTKNSKSSEESDMMRHCGTKPGRFETANSLPHELESERASKQLSVAARAGEHGDAGERVSGTNERCE